MTTMPQTPDEPINLAAKRELPKSAEDWTVRQMLLDMLSELDNPNTPNPDVAFAAFVYNDPEAGAHTKPRLLRFRAGKFTHYEHLGLLTDLMHLSAEGE